MDVIYGLIPGMIILGIIAVAVLFWAAKSGQFEDMDGEAYRILMDDDLDSDNGSNSVNSRSSGDSEEEPEEKKKPD
ncbi:MAG: cbb3-type cytochrome oxidase assembly protein CcoS [Motiliproteus sp.]